MLNNLTSIAIEPMHHSSTNNKTCLCLFTINFPYGKGEFFLYDEIKILSEKFQTIYIFPLDCSDKISNYILPENVIIIHFDVFQPYNRIKVLTKNFGLIASIYAIELWQSKTKLNYVSQFFKTLNNLTHKISAADNLIAELKKLKINDAIAYTYWFNQWTLILSIINIKYKEINLYTRIHGMDVYEDQHRESNFFFQFRAFQFKQIKKVLAISLNGKNHLLNANNISANKISVSRLGTTDLGLNKTEALNYFRIVSCSSFHAYKRVELIIDILSHSNKKIEWVHFGDGDQKDIIIEKVNHLPQNVSFTFMGFQKNKFIMEYYKQNHIDLFINVSETEGIPVSIMEAISFGIPVIATNVGGVAEIVNEKTGFLIDKYFDSKVTYQLIENFIEASNEVKTSLKQSSRYFWEQNYNASKNYNALSLQLV